MRLHLYDLTLWLRGNWWFLIYVMITHNKTHLTQTKGSKFKKGKQHCLHSPNAHNDLNDFCMQKGQNNNKINKQSGGWITLYAVQTFRFWRATNQKKASVKGAKDR